MTTKWLDWAQRLQAIAQTGLHFTRDPYERERFEQVREIAAEMMAESSGLPLETVRDLFSLEKGYATPKIDVRAAVFRDGKLLMVRENLDGGRWTLPGGWADVSDRPSHAVEREVLKAFFRCELLDEAPVEVRSSSASFQETGGVEFFAEDELPADLSEARVTRSQLHRLFEHHRQPDLPTDFD